MEFVKGIQDPKSCSYPSKKTSRGRRPKFGEERKKRKRRTEEFRERECQYSTEMRNRTTEEQERKRVYQQEKKNNGGAVTDIMERQWWWLEGLLEENWIWDE